MAQQPWRRNGAHPGGSGTYLKGTEVAQADDFTTLQGVGDDIFERYEYCIDIRFMHGTSLLDAFGHFADVDVA